MTVTVSRFDLLNETLLGMFVVVCAIANGGEFAITDSTPYPRDLTKGEGFQRMRLRRASSGRKLNLLVDGQTTLLAELPEGHPNLLNRPNGVLRFDPFDLIRYC